MSGPTVKVKLANHRRPRPRDESAPASETTASTTRAARMLALAHHIERLIERGELKDYADAARRLGITRARVTQVVGLTLLSPSLQEGVPCGELRPSERTLRQVMAEVEWDRQLVAGR